MVNLTFSFPVNHTYRFVFSNLKVNTVVSAFRFPNRNTNLTLDQVKI